LGAVAASLDFDLDLDFLKGDILSALGYLVGLNYISILSGYKFCSPNPYL